MILLWPALTQAGIFQTIAGGEDGDEGAGSVGNDGSTSSADTGNDPGGNQGAASDSAAGMGIGGSPAGGMGVGGMTDSAGHTAGVSISTNAPPPGPPASEDPVTQLDPVTVTASPIGDPVNDDPTNNQPDDIGSPRPGVPFTWNMPTLRTVMDAVRNTLPGPPVGPATGRSFSDSRLAQMVMDLFSMIGPPMGNPMGVATRFGGNLAAGQVAQNMANNPGMTFGQVAQGAAGVHGGIDGPNAGSSMGAGAGGGAGISDPTVFGEAPIGGNRPPQMGPQAPSRPSFNSPLLKSPFGEFENGGFGIGL